MMWKEAMMALAFACVLTGCDKRDPQPASPPPEAYMKDKAFMRELDRRKDLRDDLLARRVQVDEALSAERARDPASDRVKDLQKQLDALDAAFETNRMETYRFVRERLTKEKGKK